MAQKASEVGQDLKHIRYINLRKWFPPDDELAVNMARLSILREDFAIEMKGLYEETLHPLDANSPLYRRIYFWRNMIRTALEISSVVRRLETMPEFMEGLKQLSKKNLGVDLNSKFYELHREFDKQHRLLKDLRNDIGGHVQHNTLADALREMPEDLYGYLEAGETVEDIHQRFAGELVLGMIVVGVPKNERGEEVDRQLREIGKLLPAFALMHIAFAVYMHVRGLAE
jgi:hypothetical protein